MRDVTLWRFIVEAMERRERLMLLLVVEHTPGSPGRQGFKMALTQTGAHCGTIGGGIMEYKLVGQAARFLQAGDQRLHCYPQNHSATARRWRSGMICAGSQTIVMCPIGPERLAEMAAVAAALGQGHRVQMSVAEGGALSFQDMQSQQAATKYRYKGEAMGAWAYEEALGPEFYMHIVGGGHVGLALSRVMANLDCYILLFDHRPDVASLQANTFAHRIVVGPYDEMAPQLREGPSSYVAIVSTSFKTDEAALRQTVSKDFAYLGVMGSGAKIEHLLTLLRQDGVPAAQLQRVKAPIGLAIHSRTTEEIAISIAAEIIQHKNAAGT